MGVESQEESKQARGPVCFPLRPEARSQRVTEQAGDERINGPGDAKEPAGPGSPKQIDSGDEGWFVEPDVFVESRAVEDAPGGGEREVFLGP